MELAPGRVLSHRYQIVRQLGKGGFGQTFVAIDLLLPDRNQCAIKQLKPQSSDPDTIETARRLFATEAKMLQELGDHPLIPRLFAYFEEDREFFLVQEYINGTELGTEIAEGVYRGNEQKVAALLGEILEVLDFVHQKQVIHRDLNPFNLIRRHSDRSLVLIDFGAVKQITTQLARGGKTLVTVAIGTPGYFPSEQAHGHPQKSSDIYAVGMIGLQALTGQNPAEIPLDPRTGEICWQPLVTTSAEFRRLLDRMIRYDFRQRYPSASEALRELRKWYPQTRSSTRATLVVKPRRQGKKTRRSGFNNAVMLCGTIGVLVGGYFGFIYWRDTRNTIDLFDRGQTLYQMGKYGEALTAYREVLKINPEHGGAFKGQGDALLALNRSREALIAYEKAIELVPDDWQAWVGRGEALAKSGKKTAAIETFDRALTLNANAWQAWQGKAEVYLALQQYSAALKSLEKLLTFQPDNASFWYQKGWTLQNLNNDEAAVQAYEKTLSIEPDNALAWYQKGNGLQNLKKFPEALESYKKAVEFKGDFSQAYYSQGSILQKLGRTEEALTAFIEATKANRHYYQAWLQQGAILHQLTRYREAIAAYQQASRVNSRQAAGFLGTGNAWYRLGKYTEAIAAYQQAIARQGDNPDTWKSLGDSWFNLGKYAEAIAAYDRALRYRSIDSQARTQKQAAENRQRQAIEAAKATEKDKHSSPQPVPASH